MRNAIVVIGLVCWAAWVAATDESGATKAQRAERALRLPALAATDEIHVSRDSSDSGAYVVIRPSGELIFVTYRSAMNPIPKDSLFTTAVKIDFAHWHAQLSSQAALEKTSPDDKLVYFMGRGSGSGHAVYIPAQKAQDLLPLFAPFLKPSKTPP
jgi:hypothetical protein